MMLLFDILTMYQKLVKRATSLAVCSAIFLIIIKLWTWWLTGSISLLASLVDSSMDLLASILNFWLVRYALKPADSEHQFGHGKAESLSSLAQSTFILGSALFLLLNSFKLLVNPVPLNQPILGITVSFISALVTFALVSYQRYVVRKTKSVAIRADMLHYIADLLVNLTVILSLFLSFIGFVYADALFAILIGIYIFYGAIKIASESLQDLLDKALNEDELTKICDIINNYPEVNGYHDLKTRRSGQMIFIQLHIELDEQLFLREAHDIADKLESDITQLFECAEVLIHQDPIIKISKK